MLAKALFQAMDDAIKCPKLYSEITHEQTMENSM